jgi:PAS domain S-box-containing protein/diguanylate cyclase (GGDEF)-like protein
VHAEVMSDQGSAAPRTAPAASALSIGAWRALVEHSADVAALLDVDGRVTYVSPAVQSLLGYLPEELVGTPVVAVVDVESADSFRASWGDLVASSAGSRSSIVGLQHRDGSRRTVLWSGVNQLADERVGAVVCSLRDEGERLPAAVAPLTDPRTGLAHGVLLNDRLQRALGRASRSGQPLAVLWLQLDGFHEIGQGSDQDAGEELLRQVASRLRSVVAEDEDTVARLDADEFVVVSEGADSPATALGLAQELLEQLTAPLEVDGVVRQISAWVGVALSDPSPDSGLATEQGLLAAARTAAHEASSRASGHVLLYDPNLLRPDERAALADELAAALEQGQLRLHFQPIIDLQTGRWDGAEALLRWQHPTRGLLGPAAFLGVAEETGLTPAIGDWVVDQAARQLAAWAGDPQTQGRHLAVNLSVRQLCRDGAAQRIVTALQSAGAPPDGLVIEVTESAVVDDPQVAVAALGALKAAGIRLALDDFGTGYSSLTYLRRLPFDFLKVDRAFVAGLGRNEDDSAIVASVISLAKAIGVAAVAEGVETEAQRATLASLGCRYGQGYLWSRAVPADELEARLSAPPAPAAAPQRQSEPAEVPAEAVEQILRMHRDGASLHTIAAALNADGHQTDRGRRWHPRSVARVVVSSEVPAG